MLEEFTVKVKDYRQDITHTLHEYSSTRNGANYKAMRYLVKSFGHTEFEIVGKGRATKKPKPVYSTTPLTETYKVPVNRNEEIATKWA